jgi:uncharacterized membrane protein YbhN (UPF0104 family)
LETATSGARGGRNWKKLLFFLVKFLVSGTILYLVLKKVGAGDTYNYIKGNLRPVYFAAAVLVYLFSLFVSTLRWRLLIPSRPKTFRLFALYLMGSFFNTVLPGVVGGDAVKVFYLFRTTGNMAEAMASIFMERYLGLVALMLLGLTALPLNLDYVSGTKLLWLFPVLLGGFLAASLAFFGLRLGRRFKLLADFYGYFKSYDFKTLSAAFAMAVFVQVSTVIMVFVLSRGFGQDVPLRLFFLVVPVITTFAAIPLSISGLGIREGSFVVFFAETLHQMGGRAATALSLSWFLAMAAGASLGLFVYLKIKTK